MNSDSVAIRVSDLSKCYSIYATPHDRLKQFVLPRTRHYLRMAPRNYFREFWALKDVSFEINKGEAVGIIGRNGAGKSTLLQLICGTLSPTGGAVEVSGTVAALLELGSGFNPEFTGRENVYLNASVLGFSREVTDAAFDDIVAFADIGDFLDQPTKTYSSGMLMRLAFAVNTSVNPEILIVDEALGVGDAPFQSKCFKRLRQLRDDGTSVLFVSHDISTVRSICSRALWLKSGKAEAWGNAMEVSRVYEKFCWQEQGVGLGNSTDDSSPSGSPRLIEPNATLKEFDGTRSELSWCTSRLSPLESSDRYGNRDIAIEGFEIRNESGEVVTSCSYGEQLEFVYYLEATKDFSSDVAIGLVFRDRRGVDIFAAHNFASDDKLEMKKGQRIVAVAKLGVPLTHQDYVIQIGIFGFSDGAKYRDGEYDFSRAIMLDVIEKALILTVAPFKLQPLGGPVHAPMSFEFIEVKV